MPFGREDLFVGMSDGIDVWYVTFWSKMGLLDVAWG